MKRLPYSIRSIWYDFERVVRSAYKPEYPKEFWYSLQTLTIDRLQRWCKWLFRPWNTLKIRNVPRSYSDKDYLMFHACFTLLCNFVEREFARITFDEYVKWCEEEWAKPVNEFGYKEFPEHQYKAAILFKELYDWYTAIDWNDPVPYFESVNCKWAKKEDAFWELCQTNLKRLIEQRESMWT